MKSEIFKAIHDRLRSLSWMKHVALYQQQDINSEKNIPWNSPACFIGFDQNPSVKLLGGSRNEVITNINIRFVMRDYLKDQLLTLEYSDMINKVLFNFGADKWGGCLIKIDDYTDITADALYVYQIIFQTRYLEDMNECSVPNFAEIEKIGIQLLLTDENFVSGEDWSGTNGSNFIEL